MISSKKVGWTVTIAALLLASACSDNEVTTEPIVPAKLVVVGSSSVSASAGFPVTPLLRVKLLTKGNQPVSRQVVHFTVSSGGLLSADSSFTDENGEAAVGVTVGAVGDYTVTATVAGVAPVTFTATATAPVAALVLAGEGNNQSGLATEPLAPIKALVLKSDGSPAAGVTVNFQVTSGGGSVSPGSVVTDANGIATTTFTLGASGTQTVTATAPGIGSATFTETIADPCTAARTLGIPATLSRALDATDCKRADNRFIEYFNVSGANTAAFQITETSSAFTPSLTLFSAAGTDTIGFNAPASGGTATFFAILPAATYRAGATSLAANATGAYTLTTASLSGVDITNCPRGYVAPGVTLNQTISATDCVFSGDATQKSDQYRIFLKAGQVIRITLEAIPLSNSSIDLWIRVLNIGTNVATNQDCCAGATVETLNYTATTTGQHRIEAGVFFDATAPTPTTGAYKMVISTP